MKHPTSLALSLTVVILVIGFLVFCAVSLLRVLMNPPQPTHTWEFTEVHSSPTPARVLFPASETYRHFSIPENQQGYDAFWFGKSWTNNPYNFERDPFRYNAWNDGWWTARAQKQEGDEWDQWNNKHQVE